jgi:predicted nucleic acid-binding protein
VGKAGSIVSGDHHLLDLGSVEGIEVLSPRKFLDRLGLIG